jgi:predicted ATP-grasp superfamily ATP-dependent carboligase
MRIFVYEYFTSLGLSHGTGSAKPEIDREGWAMWQAVVADFRALDGVEVRSLPQGLTPEGERQAFRQTLEGCDYALLIAPETDGILRARCEWAAEAGVPLLSSSVSGVALTGDKLELAGLWKRHGVPTPRTIPFGSGWDHYPAVLKPRDGAGSQATFLVRSAQEVPAVQAAYRAAGFHDERMVWQEFVAGQPASVSFLIGPRTVIPLPPATQQLSDDGHFRYRGGELPIPRDRAARATRIGSQAVQCVPGLLGYVGVDVILGEATDGSQDLAVEINPRLTTSYVGLRQLARFNLAEAMLRVATGGELSSLNWKPGRVRFYPDGRCELLLQD